MNHTKDYTLAHLVAILTEEGIINPQTLAGGKTTIHSWIKTGKLKLRQRPHSKWYVVNDKEVSGILKEFSFGGKGHYYSPYIG